jgi:hypothetical protein
VGGGLGARAVGVDALALAVDHGVVDAILDEGLVVG